LPISARHRRELPVYRRNGLQRHSQRVHKK
jgi:hypothetical protein